MSHGWPHSQLTTHLSDCEKDRTSGHFKVSSVVSDCTFLYESYLHWHELTCFCVTKALGGWEIWVQTLVQAPGAIAKSLGGWEIWVQTLVQAPGAIAKSLGGWQIHVQTLVQALDVQWANCLTLCLIVNSSNPSTDYKTACFENPSGLTNLNRTWNADFRRIGPIVHFTRLQYHVSTAI